MYWYHISDTWTEPNLIVKPRRICKLVAECAGEPLTPRICVCPSIVQCLVAMGDYNLRKRHYVYQYEGETEPPVSVYDSEYTGERWILKPANFIKVYEFPKEIDFPFCLLWHQEDVLFDLIETALVTLSDFLKTLPLPEGIRWICQ